MKFIYIFNNSDKERLVKSGYKLLKEDNINSIYVFESSTELSFAEQGVEKYVFSNVLTF